MKQNKVPFNGQLLKIEKTNSFLRSSQAVALYRKQHPEKDIVSLGIGDVSFPVPRPITEAMKNAAEELASMDSFHGYGAYYGIEALRKAIAENDYRGLDITADEIYVGDGTKTDCTAILELFSTDASVLVGNPTYPIYKNGAYAMGRNVESIECNPVMKVPEKHYDIIYICSPCNPIGNAYTREQLTEWTEYANRNGSIIIYDNVYHDFIESPDVPHSIYEIEGSRSCAIELRSFSKNASFSGTRCSYMVIPKEFGEEFHALWKERTLNRFNGACYIAQKGAQAYYTDEVRTIVAEQIKAYKDNARMLRELLLDAGFDVTGGIDSPYLWVQTPDRREAWDAFSFFLEELNIVVIPGSIFGSEGANHIRISSLGTKKDCEKAAERIKAFYIK